jgi:hypothetical protein
VTPAVAPTLASEASRYYRSVRVEADFFRDDALDGYQVTPQVLGLVRRFAHALAPGSTDRAWTVTGPYGGGKSAFALYLSRLVEDLPRGLLSWAVVNRYDDSILSSLRASLDGRGLLAVPITARREPLADTLVSAIGLALDRLAPSAAGRRLSKRVSGRC